ncbi:hypothetical protein T439DRAFT_327527 [Meredithblackwellia eburnea MCA 4105]
MGALEGVITISRRLSLAEAPSRRTTTLVAGRLFVVVALVFLLSTAGRHPQVDEFTTQLKGHFKDFKSWTPPAGIFPSVLRYEHEHEHDKLPRAVLGNDNTTFTQYLDARWPEIVSPEDAASSFRSDGGTSPLPPHIWITLAGPTYVDTGLANLVAFVSQLNQERAIKYGKNTRETVLITLCLDEKCVKMCAERNFYCWGGYEYKRPKQNLQATWPKLAGMMEVLQKRDTFFVDADVFFRLDPYPHMLPLLKDFDFIVQEEGNDFHFNTGWFWMRRGPKSVESWRAVYDMDMKELSRDQRNLNKFFNTTGLRVPNPADKSNVQLDFISPNGVRVKLLDPELFFSFHFEDMLVGIRPDAVYVHATCLQEKFAMAKHQGFWGDIDGYYSSPLPVLTFDHHSGTVEEVTLMARIVIAAARYVDRAFQPASTTTFTKVVTAVDTFDRKEREHWVSRRPYYSFPYERIGRALNVTMVEASYNSHSARHLLGKSVLAHGEQRLGWTTSQERVAKAAEMLHVSELDIRRAKTFSHLISLLLSPQYRNVKVVKLVHFEWPDDAGRWENWRYWVVPGPMDAIVPCNRLEHGYLCSYTCTWDGLPPGLPDWPSQESLLKEVEAHGLKRARRIR